MKSKNTQHDPQQLDMRDLVAFMPMGEFIATEQSSTGKKPSGGFFWSDTGIVVLMEKLLLQSTRSLIDSRCSKATWEDVTSWMFAENDSNPFSFESCCQQMGYDPCRYREAVVEFIKFRRPDALDLVIH